LVGDIIQLADGILIPADGIMISGSDIEIVEAAMTGENDALKKMTIE
jgi:magnesium-transporting ATPase (P-type)